MHSQANTPESGVSAAGPSPQRAKNSLRTSPCSKASYDQAHASHAGRTAPGAAAAPAGTAPTDRPAAGSRARSRQRLPAQHDHVPAEPTAAPGSRAARRTCHSADWPAALQIAEHGAGPGHRRRQPHTAVCFASAGQLVARQAGEPTDQAAATADHSSPSNTSMRTMIRTNPKPPLGA